jgi:murein DD-endopeptidase MepM/ murein hydrolase activator NlpD
MADETFLTYRLLSERDSLLAANQRLQQELDAVKARAIPVGTSFEASVRAQLDELQAVIAAATELDLGDGDPVLVRKGKKGAQEVASLKGAKGAKGANAQDRKKLGMGGKEVDCDHTPECDQNVGKENISLQIGPSFFREQETESTKDLAPTQVDLMRRVTTLAEALRALPLGYPSEGDVTSHFGYRVSPFSRRGSFHEGMDISLDRGGDVLATGDGVVSAVKHDGAYGWLVDITHSSSVDTRYAHLSKTLVQVGQSVKRGNRIALSGNTGRSTGPHLHYEVRINGQARNPKAFVMLPEKLARVL